MKKIIAVVLALGIVSGPGYCDMPPVQLQLTMDRPQIFVGDFVTANLQITNTGTTDLEFAKLGTPQFDNLLVVDNPKVNSPSGRGINGGGISILSINGQPPTVPKTILKPGQNATGSIGFYISPNDESIGPITFKVGFKNSPEAQIVWSNPITISFKKIDDLLTQDKLDFEEINLSGPCYQVDFKIQNVVNNKEVENQIVINDEQTYEQFVKLRQGLPSRVCSEDEAYKDCMKFACKGVPSVASDPQKLFACADKLCRTTAPRDAKACLDRQAMDQQCAKVSLPPIDFTKKTIIGQYTSGSCATSGFKKEVFKDDKAKTITYFVTTVSDPNRSLGCMGAGAASTNLIAIPKVPADYKVIFYYKFF